MNRIKVFLRREAVLVISALAAMVSMCFIPPSSGYLQYIDWQVLALLLCLMLVVAGLKKTGLFDSMANSMTAGLKNSRMLSLALVLLCFFSAMFITNDVALITFVPFTLLVMTAAGLADRLIYVVVLETIAANLGSMLTPVGNPQNLFLYATFQMEPVAFMTLTLPIATLSLVLLVILTLMGENRAITPTKEGSGSIRDKRRLVVYGLLFALCLLAVVRVVNVYLMLAIVLIAILICDRRLFKQVDYGLLATFICFFIFVGNLGNLSAVKDVLSGWIAGRELIASVLISQVISNVPAAVLLSGFTQNADALVVGTNIGGLGTLVASLASLIAFKIYAASNGAKPLKYLIVFTGINLGFLILLLAAVWFIPIFS